MTDAVLESIAHELRRYPALEGIGVVATSWGRELRLPLPPGAEYQLVFAAQEDEHRTEAQPVLGVNEGDPGVFWYHRFELPEYRNSQELLSRAFRDEALALATSPTRIRQERGWLLWTFSLERLARPDQWEHVSSMGSARWMGRPPRSGTDVVDSSPAPAGVIE